MARRGMAVLRMLIAGTALAGAVGGCKNLGLAGEPEEMTVDVQSSDVSQVTIITSTRWNLENDPACDPNQQQCDLVLRVLEADTTSVGVPFKRTYGFTDTFRYLVEAYPTGDVGGTLALKIDIDGRPWYEDSRPLAAPDANGERESLLFTYIWQEPTIN
ncbi:MAG: hypothetical protein R3E10_11725 [Gemmatimonadota bacterium]